MDESRLVYGDKAYAAGDWRAAAREYLAAVQGSEPAGTGRAYHMAGNSLMKLRRHGDAATVYGHALRDESYGKRGAILTNLGSALAADGHLSEAVQAFESAMEDPANEAPWKAQQGKAGALYDMGRFEEACQAYRDAAWAEGNPDPGKSLNNLGMCFMTLGRPEEAVGAYKAAVSTDGYAAKGRASANLGLAYSSMGFHEEAVRAFEAARDEFGYELSDAVLAAYESSVAAGSHPEAEPAEEPVAEVAIPPAPEPEEAVATGDLAATAEDDAFFTMTEDEMRVRGRAANKAERRDRLSGRGLALRVGLSLLALIVIFGGFAVAAYMGLGYPSQSATVSGLIDAYRAGRPVAGYWVAVPVTDVRREMRTLPARFESYSIESVAASAASSTADVTVRLDRNGTQRFQVSLVREGVGWKVNGIRNDWRSTGDGI